jgi:hypothetical protein
VFEAVDKPAARDFQAAEPAPRSRTHSNAVLHLPSVHANDSAAPVHVVEQATTPEKHMDAECVAVTAFVTDEHSQGLPQFLGTINVKRRTSYSELHAELSRMLVDAGVCDATMPANEAFFLRDPSSRTWKPLP